MSADDVHLLIAYLIAVATVVVVAGIFNDLWKNRKH